MLALQYFLKDLVCVFRVFAEAASTLVLVLQPQIELTQTDRRLRNKIGGPYRH